MAIQIKSIFAQDENGNEVEIDATAFLYMLLSSKGNIEITSPKNINIEPTKSLKIKAGNGAQVELLADHTGDVSEVLVKALTSVDANGNELDKEKPVRLKINSTELELNTKDAQDINTYDIKFKTGVKSSAAGEHYCQTKLKGRSFDIRCYEHGGVALQPCGTDSKNKENKIKFESSRKTALGATAEYADEGGKGLEFGTFNNEHASLFCGDYRFKGDAPIYGVTRGAVTETTNDSGDTKWDYPTQTDDTKDIINDANPITWNDLIKGIKYLKSQGVI